LHAVVFFTGGALEMDAQQKSDFLSFTCDDGRGFIGIHSAAITFVDWTEYARMIGNITMRIRGGLSTLPLLSKTRSFLERNNGQSPLCYGRRSIR
jgi:uncharacterized protein